MYSNGRPFQEDFAVVKVGLVTAARQTSSTDSEKWIEDVTEIESCEQMLVRINNDKEEKK